METITVQINPNSTAGRRILKDIAENPKAGNIIIPGIERDENGRPLGTTVDEFCDELLRRLEKRFSVAK